MAIKAAGGNPPTNSLSFLEIENEFGQNATRSLGAYRMNNFDIGALTEVSLSRDGCGINANSDIPVDNQEIKFSDFFSAKQNIIVDLHSSDENRVNAKNDKYNASATPTSGKFIVVGSSSKPITTSGKKIIIHVTKTIGSSQGSINNVALRTGNWDSGTEVLVEVATGGLLIGAGGKGGDGVESGGGLPGESGTSALGIDYDGTDIQTTGGSIICGFGGGGAGGGGETKREGNWRGRGRGPEVKAGGGGGGGGMGIPAGNGGTSPEGRNGTAGSATAAGNGGEGAEEISSGGGEQAIINGGTGGEGGSLVSGSAENADAGSSAFLSGNGPHEDAGTSGGGNGGANGSAIRKGSGISFNLIGSVNRVGDVSGTGVS